MEGHPKGAGSHRDVSSSFVEEHETLDYGVQWIARRRVANSFDTHPLRLLEVHTHPCSVEDGCGKDARHDVIGFVLENSSSELTILRLVVCADSGKSHVSST